MTADLFQVLDRERERASRLAAQAAIIEDARDQFRQRFQDCLLWPHTDAEMVEAEMRHTLTGVAALLMDNGDPSPWRTVQALADEFRRGADWFRENEHPAYLEDLDWQRWEGMAV